MPLVKILNFCKNKTCCLKAFGNLANFKKVLTSISFFAIILPSKSFKEGRFEGKPCVEIQPDREVIEAFFGSFGSLLGTWVDGEAV